MTRLHRTALATAMTVFTAAFATTNARADDVTAFLEPSEQSGTLEQTTPRVPTPAKPGIEEHTDNLQFEFHIRPGWRRDELDWSIAGRNVNVLSELAWKDLQSVTLDQGLNTQRRCCAMDGDGGT